jgi:hypothetical protein
MGTCCGAHLQTKIRDYARNAQNGAVTVTVIENPGIKVQVIDESVVLPPTTVKTGKCDYCEAPAEFTVSYYPKP